MRVYYSKKLDYPGVWLEGDCGIVVLEGVCGDCSICVTERTIMAPQTPMLPGGHAKEATKYYSNLSNFYICWKRTKVHQTAGIVLVKIHTQTLGKKYMILTQSTRLNNTS